MDTQEDQLKMISSPKAILREEFGREPAYLHGKIEKILEDNETITKTVYVLSTDTISFSLTLLIGGPPPMLALMSSYSRISAPLFGQAQSLRSNGRRLRL